MDSFEANKIFGAVLGVIFVLFGGSLLAEGIFHSEVPEKPGYAIQAMEAPAGGAAEAGADPNAVTPVAEVLANANAEAGATQFKKCQACHSGEKGGPNKVGPDLWDVVERPIAHHEGFAYSAAMKDFATKGDGKWDWDKLNHFIHGPKQYISGTAMGFAGIKNDKDRGDLLAYLRTLSDSPKELPKAEPAAAPAEGAAPAPTEGAAPAPGAGEAGNAAAPSATTDPNQDSQPQAPAAGVGATPASPSTPPGPAAGNAAPAAPAGQPASPPAPPAAPAAPATPAPAPAN